MLRHVQLMAHYNQWMNARVYEAAGRLSHDSLAQDRQAFFGSILGTLNHLVVADTIWPMSCVMPIPKPKAWCRTSRFSAC